jgi:hypothetical protein
VRPLAASTENTCLFRKLYPFESRTPSWLAEKAVSLLKTQIRAYRWCNPPKIGSATMSPNRSTGRVLAASSMTRVRWMPW